MCQALTRERVPQTTVQRLLTHTLLNSWTILIKDFFFFSCFIPEHTNDVFIFIDPVYYSFSNLNLLQFYRIHSSSCPKNSEIIWNQRKESRWRFSLASQILTFSLWNYMRSFSSGPTALWKTASLHNGSKNWSYFFLHFSHLDCSLLGSPFVRVRFNEANWLQKAKCSQKVA